MAKLTYNGITLSGVKITRFSTENEFDTHNFNRTCKRHTLTGVGIYTSASTTFDNKLNDVRNAMTVPAKQLSIQFDDGANYVYANGADQATAADASNGPHPEIQVTEIVGGYVKPSFVVGFTFKWVACGSSLIQRAELVTNHHINEDGLLRITRRGFLSISAAAKGPNTPVTTKTTPSANNPYPEFLDPNISTVAAAPHNPDMYRRLIAGIPPKGFQRTKQDFYVQPDQVTLAFDIEDMQNIAQLPQPAINGDASFEYNRSIEKGSNQITGIKTFHCELTGVPGTPKSDLLLRCIDVAMTRIRFVDPDPDIVLSFKIAEPSLFKRNSVSLDITARGTLRDYSMEPGTSTDAWLYIYMFSDPNTTQKQAYVDAYGSIVSTQATYIPQFRYDPCTLNTEWVAIAGSGSGFVVTIDPDKGETESGALVDSGGKPTYSEPKNAPDETLKSDAATKIVAYNASQSIDINSNMNFLMPMGVGIQYGFQFALPEVVITQKVEMTTRQTGMAIPWPYVGDAYIVLSQHIQTNDATPDASGNRLIVVHATRTIKVSVWNSDALYDGAAASSLTGGEGGTTAMIRKVWMPTSIPLPRNPITGNNTITLMENINGDVVRQDYIGNGMGGGDTAET